MSITIMSRVWDKSKHKSNNRLMLLAIADNANDDGLAWPGMLTLAKKMGGMSRRTAGQRVLSLAKTNELGVYPRSGGSHDYIVMVGMSRGDVKNAIRKLATRRGMSISDLIDLRRKYAGGGAQESARVPALESAQGVRRNPVTNHQEPSGEPPRPAFVLFWENEIHQPFPSGTFLEMMNGRIEQYGIEQAKEAVRIASKKGKAYNVRYIDGILRNGGADSLAAKLDRHVGPASVRIA